MLSADFADLRADVDDMTAAGSDLLHLDVMDGHFVPNLTFGPFICQAIRRISALPLDAHLMISNPGRYVDSFARSGVDGITIHAEVDGAIEEVLDLIGSLGCKRGISIKPGTPVDDILPLLDRVDLVLVMSVEPGFGGQDFNPVAVDKISDLSRRRQTEGHDFLISVDGGINAQTGPECRQAGADILVSGSWLFGAEDRVARIDLLRG